MRKNVHDVMAWEHQQVVHGSPVWRGLCQRHARSAWGLPAWAASAKIAWGMVPAAHRHESDYRHVPAGALIYDPALSSFGHAWVSAGNGLAFSTDYRRRGMIDLVPAHLPAWRHGKTTVSWTDWTPRGVLPIDMHGHAGTRH